MDATSTTEPFPFQSPVNPTDGEGSMVRETRREIATIVRETAQLARQEIAAESFFRTLCERVGRAMAAEGVVVWRRHEATFQVAARIGKITDQSIDCSQEACHQKMLQEVVQGDQPVVVPSSPEATDPSFPSNPTLVPVAVVPIIESDTRSPEYVLEVFLEGDGGPASQRGYLRFAAQMADLAGDYLRLDRIRKSEQQAIRWQAISAALPELHRSLDPDLTAARVVDAASELFGIDRVSLCQVSGNRAHLIAVSHLDDFDSRTPEAAEICRLAILGNDARDRPEKGPTLTETAEASEAGAEPPLKCEEVIVVGTTERYRLVFQNRILRDSDSSRSQDVAHFTEHAATALENAETFCRIPWARTAASLLPARGGRGRSRRGMFALIVLACLVAIIACMPVPMKVTGRAELSAVGTQFLYAPAAGTISEVFVQHGQAVDVGDPLMQMVDRTLDEQAEVLLGQQAVLIERTAELSGQLMNGTSRRREDQTRSQSEQKVIAQQLDSLDRQLAMLAEQRERLTIRSDREGIVDGWRLKRNMEGRPVKAGEPLLAVIQPDQGWLVEAFIPQSRLDHFLTQVDSVSVVPSQDREVGIATTDGELNDLFSGDSERPTLKAQVVLQSHPQLAFTAQLVDVGPAIVQQADTGPVSRALFELSSEGLPAIQTGSPATVSIDCGRRPLAYVAFQDFIRTFRGAVGLYL